MLVGGGEASGLSPPGQRFCRGSSSFLLKRMGLPPFSKKTGLNPRLVDSTSVDYLYTQSKALLVCYYFYGSISEVFRVLTFLQYFEW